MDIKKNDIAVRTELSYLGGSASDPEVLANNIVGKLVQSLRDVSGDRFPYLSDKSIPSGKWRKATLEETSAYLAGARHVSEVSAFVPGYVQDSIPKQSDGRDDKGRYTKNGGHPPPYFAVGRQVTYLDYKQCIDSRGKPGNIHFGGGSETMTGTVDTIDRIHDYVSERGCYEVRTKIKGYDMLECEFLEYRGPAEINMSGATPKFAEHQYGYDDSVQFILRDKTYDYRVSQTHLVHTGGENNIIFKQLEIADKYNFASSCYGYKTNSGDWPDAKEGDYVALTRLIHALKKECKRVDKERGIPKPISLELKYQNRDNVTFQVNGIHYEYMVGPTHLRINKYDNDIIFRELGLTARGFCETRYGYCPVNSASDEGSWPEYEHGDYAAANRVIIAIRAEISKSRSASECINSESLIVAITDPGKSISFTKKPIADHRLKKFQSVKSKRSKNKLIFNKKQVKTVSL